MHSRADWTWPVSMRSVSSCSERHCENMAVQRWTCVWGPLLLVGIFTGFITALEVTVLDTRKYERLDWTRFSTPNVEATWKEATFNTPSSDTQRIYTVCQVTKVEVKNWLRTPYIPRGDAKRLYIEMTFTMRRCTKFPDPELLQQCKESFKLLYYESDSDIANSTYPAWSTSVYKHKDVIAADRTFTDNNNVVSNIETRDIAVTKKGVYFAFFDEGGCTTLLSIRIYYKLCETVTVKFAIFPNTTTGHDDTAVVPRNGVCVNNAAIEKPPKNLCNQNGHWIFLSGGCKCMPGYEPHNGDKECKGCEVGKYKWRTGSESCLPCPSYSEAPNTKSVECRCLPGYYRNVNDDKSMPCTRPPSKVRNLTVTYHDPSMVNLSWRQPQDLGGRRDLYYTLECLGCAEDEKVFYVPKKTGFNTTKVSVNGLEPNSRYKLLVFAMNGVSELSGTKSSSYVVAVTDKAVNIKVRNLRLVSAEARQVLLQWDAPAAAELFEVKYYLKGHKGNTTRAILSQVTSITILGLQPSSEYYFLVRAKTVSGWGEYLKPFSVTTAKGKEPKITLVDGSTMSDSHQVNKSDGSVGVIAGSAVAVIVCMIIVIIMVVIFLRKNQRACHEKNVSDCDNLHYTNGEVQCARLVDGTRILNNGLTLPLFTQPGALKSYIDPHTYEDPNQAVREFTKEIDASLITIESVLGGGEFGDVCKGYLSHHGKRTPVAIKTLKAGASDKNRLDFLTEASIMGQFDDPNVIYLEGVVTKNNPIMIVTEYMENGALDAFLRTNDGKFTVIQLVGLLRGIASGMCYLSEMGYVHRDLAARNILVNESLVCKVADFGLSREIESDDLDGAYTTKGGKIPVRWTAPEAIAYRKFTSASDCWSYGIVMWEVMSYGERPYWNWSNQDVIKAVEKGFRLTAPMDCPEAVHQLMLDCWQKERSHRPKFAAIVKTIDKLIRAPELLRKIAKPRPSQFLNPNMPDLTQLTGIEDWLTSIKMERYAENFSRAGYTRMDQVAQITPKNLENLGITLAGHQKKIMNSVQMLRVQLGGAQVSEGFLV